MYINNAKAPLSYLASISARALGWLAVWLNSDVADIKTNNSWFSTFSNSTFFYSFLSLLPPTIGMHRTHLNFRAWCPVSMKSRSDCFNSRYIRSLTYFCFLQKHAVKSNNFFWILHQDRLYIHSSTAPRSLYGYRLHHCTSYFQCIQDFPPTATRVLARIMQSLSLNGFPLCC